jgi:flagellar protein FlbD
MIAVTCIGNQPRLLNPDLIEYIETVPETMLVMVNGHRHMVAESPDTVVERIVEFRRSCCHNHALAAATLRSGTVPAETER